jgi:hypothetical protein
MIFLPLPTTREESWWETVMLFGRVEDRSSGGGDGFRDLEEVLEKEYEEIRSIEEAGELD